MKIQKPPFKIKAIVPVHTRISILHQSWLTCSSKVKFTFVNPFDYYYYYYSPPSNLCTHINVMYIYMYVVLKCHLQVVLLILGEYSP